MSSMIDDLLNEIAELKEYKARYESQKKKTKSECQKNYIIL